MKLVFPALLFLGALGECRYLGARPARWAPLVSAPAGWMPASPLFPSTIYPCAPCPLPFHPYASAPAARRRSGPAHLLGEEPV